MAIGLERLERLVAAGVDVAVIDTAHGYTALVLETIREVKRRYPDWPLSPAMWQRPKGRALIKAGADAVKVGIGAGSICTTRVVAGLLESHPHGVLVTKEAPNYQVRR
jgi:IMP dehydrogenase